jgi:FkbM family methyltransferase
MRERLFRIAKAIARALMATPLRYVPGGRAAYELVYKRLAPSDPVVVEFEGSRVCVDPRDVGVSLYLITEGAYEPRLTELLKQLIEPGMVVVDGGANVGCFTMLAARLVGEAGHVYAFEPVPANFELLRRGVELNAYGNVTANRCALADRAGTATLHLDRSNFGAPSLGEANVAELAGTAEAPTVALDDFLAGENRPVDLIKLDTQGAEGLVLAGAERTLGWPRQLRVVMEFWPAGLRNMGTDPAGLLGSLRERGFELSWLDERSGRLEGTPDAVAIADCEAREHEQGYATLVLRR